MNKSVHERSKSIPVMLTVAVLLCCCAKSSRTTVDKDAGDSSIVTGCGNGLIEPGELCDDGNSEDEDRCSADCLSIDVCPQGVLKGSLIIPNRNDVAIGDLAGCNRITGSVFLSDFETSNLDELKEVTAVEGDLIIGAVEGTGYYDPYHKPALVDIKGLSNLVSVGGDFIIDGNSNLTTLEGLERLESVGGDFILKGNSLTSLDPLDNLTRIGGRFYLLQTYLEKILVGPKELTVVGGDLIIEWNLEYFGPTFSEKRGLETIVGFEKLRKIGGHLIIMTNDKLRDIDAFGALESIGGDFVILGSEISVWQPFENLSSIGGDLCIWGNGLLESILPQSIPTTIGGRVFIWENEILPTCEAASFEEALSANGFTGEVVICENQEDECGLETCPDYPFPDWDLLS